VTTDLLAAVKQRRGEVTSLGDDAASAIIAREIPPIANSAVRRLSDSVRPDLLDEAIAHTVEVTWRGLCRAREEGEVVSFIQRVAVNFYIGQIRQERRWSPLAGLDSQSLDAQHVPGKERDVAVDSDGPDSQLAAAEVLRCLHTLRAKILLISGRRAKRVRAYLDHRMPGLAPDKPPAVAPVTDEKRRERDRLYQDRCTGGRYAEEAVSRLQQDGQLSQEELALAARLLSDCNNPDVNSGGDIDP
jgi:DNA-directed RNA polymerase specialized sigma24 family protein